MPPASVCATLGWKAHAQDMSALVKLHIVLKPLMLRRVKSSKDENGEPLVKLPPKARRARARLCARARPKVTRAWLGGAGGAGLHDGQRRQVVRHVVLGFSEAEDDFYQERADRDRSAAAQCRWRRPALVAGSAWRWDRSNRAWLATTTPVFCGGGQALLTRGKAKMQTYLEAGTVLSNYANILELLLRLRQARCAPHAAPRRAVWDDAKNPCDVWTSCGHGIHAAVSHGGMVAVATHG
jgi:SNF2 family DNA or RNA helicase